MDYLGRLIAAAIGARQGPPPEFRKFIADHGSQAISKIVVGRTPIFGAIDSALNLLSLGKYNSEKDKRGYDSFFHLFCIMHLHDGSRWRLEKNHVLSVQRKDVSDNDDNDAGAEYVTKAVTGRVTVASFIDKGIKYQTETLGPGPNGNFFLYSGITNNCQVCIFCLMNGSSLSDSALNEFIKQEAVGIVQGYVHSIIDQVTDIAARGDIILRGRALSGGRHVIVQGNLSKEMPWTCATLHFYTRTSNKKRSA